MKTLAVLLLPVCLAVTPPAGAQEKPRTGGTLNIGIHAGLYGLNPFIRMRSIDRNIRSLVYESPVAIDDKAEVKPLLAKSWKISPDGKEYTFVLRKGVKFHNGEEMTAEDVKWAVEYAQDPQHGASAKPHLDGVQSVRAVDRYTVRFVLKKPQVSFLSGLGEHRYFGVYPSVRGFVTDSNESFDSPEGGIFKVWLAR